VEQPGGGSYQRPLDVYLVDKRIALPGAPNNEAGVRLADTADNNIAHLTLRNAGGTVFVPTVTGNWDGIALSL